MYNEEYYYSSRFGSSSIGCGCQLFYGLSGFKKLSDTEITKSLLYALKPHLGKLTANLVLFGDGVAHGDGARFAEFITSQNLGTVVASEVVSSPLHTEEAHKGYQVWLWYLDSKAILTWYKEHLPPTPKPTPSSSTAELKVMNAGLVDDIVYKAIYR